MALHNPSELFTAGAVKLDSSPSVNLYGQLLAKQQAKWEAMDNYERSRINSVNDAGLRDIDRKTIDDRLGELKSYYANNKRDIQKGNSQAAFDYEKKFRDVRDLIAQSKDRAARHNAAMQFYNDRLKQDQRLPDDFMNELHGNDAAVGDKYVDETGEMQEYKPFDITKWASEAKPFVQDKYVKSFADIKRTPQEVRYEAIKDQPLKQLEISDEVFDNNAKQVIAARAADRYDNSYSFSNQVKSEIQDPIRRKELTDLFKQEYGVEPSMPSDYAVAYTMEMLQPKVSKQKAVDNKEAIVAANEKNRRERMAIQDVYTKGHIALANRYRDLRDDKKQEAVSGDVDAYIDNQISTGQPEAGSLVGSAISGGQPLKILKASPDDLSAFEDGGTKTFPTTIKVLPDGTFEISGDKDYPTRQLSRAQYKASLVNHVLNTPTKIGQLKTSTDKPTITTGVKKQYTLNGKAYSIDKIEKAAKQSNMSVEDYVKHFGFQ